MPGAEGESMKTKKMHMPEPALDPRLIEHTQKMIKTDYLLGINESKDYPFRKCTVCNMEKETKKEFTRNNKVCNRCKIQVKCKHKMVQSMGIWACPDVEECLKCGLRNVIEI